MSQSFIHQWFLKCCPELFFICKTTGTLYMALYMALYCSIYCLGYGFVYCLTYGIWPCIFIACGLRYGLTYVLKLNYKFEILRTTVWMINKCNTELSFWPLILQARIAPHLQNNRSISFMKATKKQLGAGNAS